MKRKEALIQEALGSAQKCSRCHKIKILQDFPTLAAEDGLPEIISGQCRQCFEEEVRQVNSIMHDRYDC